MSDELRDHMRMLTEALEREQRRADELTQDLAIARSRGFDGSYDGTEVFIQWKGTDACFDFVCECGWDGHFDGDFAYVVKCGSCGQLWEMPWHLYPRKRQRDDGMTPVEPEQG